MLGKCVPLTHPQPNPSGRLVNFTQNHVHLENKIKQTKKKTQILYNKNLSPLLYFTLHIVSSFSLQFYLMLSHFFSLKHFFFVIISNTSFFSSSSSPCCCFCSSSSFSSWLLHQSSNNNISSDYFLSLSLSPLLKLSFKSLHWNFVVFFVILQK